MKPIKPAFKSVVDLGLRDLGVRNNPRGLATQFGKMSAAIVVLAFISAIALCAVLRRTGADTGVILAFFVAWTAGGVVLAIRFFKRAPTVVVRVNADGTNQATWMLLLPSVLLTLAVVLNGGPMVIPMVVLTAITALAVWRGRGRLPEVLSKFRSVLAEDETVLGDGIGLARGAPRRDPFRLVVATDRRLIVTPTARSKLGFPLVDVPYGRMSSFGIGWRFRGNQGVLSLELASVDGEPPQTHVIASIAPANLLSIAKALESHGVQTDDSAAIAEAERGWEQAQLPGGAPRERLLDRAAMSTRDFDRGLWVLLALSAAVFYLNPLGVGLGASRGGLGAVLLGVLALCGLSGYLSGTRASLAYIAPLNLLVSPAFFFVSTSDVIAFMFVASLLAAAGLWAGSVLRGPVMPLASSGGSAPRGGLRYALSGLALTRISGVLLAGVVTLAVTASAAGFELTTLRLAVDEATAEQVPVDGRSNLAGNAASLTYTPAPGLREFITDEHWDGGPNDGARWELRSSFTQGYNVVSLAHYIFEPRLDDDAAVAEFVKDKDEEHSRYAGFPVTHRKRVIDGRTGYVWTHIGRGGYWLYSVWFPQPVHSIRVECVAKRQTGRFKRLCAEAVGSLRFH